MLLSDKDIRAEIDGGRVSLDPWDPAMVQPSSVDVRLDKFFRLFDNHKYPYIDPAAEQRWTGYAVSMLLFNLAGLLLT